MIYKALVLGCGAIGSTLSENIYSSGFPTHASAYIKSKKTKLVGMCDKNIIKAQKATKFWNMGKPFSDLDTALNETKPEIVSICTPDEYHYEDLVKVIEFGTVKAVFAEKPLTINYEDAKYIKKLSKDSNVKVAVNYTRRYSKNIQKIREAIYEGAIGEINSVIGHYTKGILHNGTHWIDLSRLLIGEIKKVQAVSPPLDYFNNDPTLDVKIEYKNKARGLLIAHKHKNLTIFEMDIIGSNGRIRIIDDGNKIEYYQLQSSPYIANKYILKMTESLKYNDVNNEILLGIQDLIFCVIKDKEPISSCNNAAINIKINELIIQSYNFEGKTVENK